MKQPSTRVCKLGRKAYKWHTEVLNTRSEIMAKKSKGGGGKGGGGKKGGLQP